MTSGLQPLICYGGPLDQAAVRVNPAQKLFYLKVPADSAGVAKNARGIHFLAGRAFARYRISELAVHPGVPVLVFTGDR